jgi:hypothetical protein
MEKRPFRLHNLEIRVMYVCLGPVGRSIEELSRKFDVLRLELRPIVSADVILRREFSQQEIEHGSVVASDIGKSGDAQRISQKLMQDALGGMNYDWPLELPDDVEEFKSLPLALAGSPYQALNIGNANRRNASLSLTNSHIHFSASCVSLLLKLI